MAEVLDLRARAAIKEFLADPATQRWVGANIGGCWDASLHFAKMLERRGAPFRFLRFPLPPALQIVAGAVQHVVAVPSVSGGEVVVDWTAANWLPGCGERPRLAPLADVVREWGHPSPLCPTCGSSGDVVAVAGGGITVRPLAEHVCSGPAAASDLEAELAAAIAGYVAGDARRAFLESILVVYRRWIDEIPDPAVRAAYRGRLADLESTVDALVPS